MWSHRLCICNWPHKLLQNFVHRGRSLVHPRLPNRAGNGPTNTDVPKNVPSVTLISLCSFPHCLSRSHSECNPSPFTKPFPPCRTHHLAASSCLGTSSWRDDGRREPGTDLRPLTCQAWLHLNRNYWAQGGWRPTLSWSVPSSPPSCSWLLSITLSESWVGFSYLRSKSKGGQNHDWRIPEWERC